MSDSLPYPENRGQTHYEGCWRVRRHHECCIDRVEALEAERDELRDLADRLKLEAQVHAMEARSQTSTVHECYQAASGARGEPGSWHGANPVRERIAELEAEVARLRDALERALTWAGRLNDAEQSSMQGHRADSVAIKGKVLREMREARRALNPNENPTEEEAS